MDILEDLETPIRTGNETVKGQAGLDLIALTAKFRQALLLLNDISAYINNTVEVTQYTDADAIAANADVLAATSLFDINRVNHVGTQTANTISDLVETIQDTVAGFLGVGSNITVNYNDASNTLTLSASGPNQFDPEATRNAIGAALIGIGNIAVTINDLADTITISTTATKNSTDEQLRDLATHTGFLPASKVSGLSLVATSNQYNDLAGKPVIPPDLSTQVAANTTAIGTKAEASDLAVERARLDAILLGAPALGDTFVELSNQIKSDETGTALILATQQQQTTQIANKVDTTDARLNDARVPLAHTQAASTIIEDSTHRFASDAEKNTWNGKQTALVPTTGLSINGATISLTTPLLKAGSSTVMFFGDSQAAYGYDSGQGKYLSDSFTTFFNLFTGGRLDQPTGHNQGIGGQNTTQMIARLGAAIAYKPSLVIIPGPTNNVTQGINAPTTLADVTQIVNAFLSVGSYVVLIPVLPRFGSFAVTGGQETLRQDINTGIYALASSRVLVPTGLEALMNDATKFSDGLHVNTTGGGVEGLAVANLVLPLLDTMRLTSQLTTDNTISTNLLFTGTTGTKTSATGTVATSWALDNSNGGGSTVVGSKTTDNNLNQQVITVSGAYTGTSKYIKLGGTVTPVQVNTGDTIQSFLDFEILAVMTGVTGVTTSTTYTDSAGNYLTDCYSYYPNDSLSFPASVGRYQFRGTPFPAPKGTANVKTDVLIMLGTAASSSPVAASVKIHKATNWVTARSTPATTVKKTTYTLNINDRSVLADASGAVFTVTLPTAVGVAGREYTIKKIDSSANVVTVATTSSQTIDGSTTYALSAQWKYVRVQSDGTNWLVIGNN
jgi:lysophospholipase L1-like esterase